MSATTLNTLITTYLEMTSPQQLQASLHKADNVRVELMRDVDVAFYRKMYRAVGEKWRWRDRLIMPREELRNILERDTTRVYVLYVDNDPAGYVELDQQGASTEIAYFGLREAYHGRGLGKFLLSFGIKEAWDLGAERVFVHTCNLDGPHALSNYRKRGFAVYQETREPMPELYA
ncbi:MAG: GNAT family N-acetyltransferase [Chloroflexota bacterium]